MGIVQSFEDHVAFWPEAAVALGDALRGKAKVTLQRKMGHGLRAIAPLKRGDKVAAYLLTQLGYIDAACEEPVVYACDLPLLDACGPAVAGWMRAAHKSPWTLHDTRIGMSSSELHGAIGMTLTDATAGDSTDIDALARRYLDAHGLAGCFCNHSPNPNAMISWTLAASEDALRCALVPVIVALRDIAPGEFVMLDYGARYKLCAQQH
jgi:hypothetical protein